MNGIKLVSHALAGKNSKRSGDMAAAMTSLAAPNPIMHEEVAAASDDRFGVEEEPRKSTNSPGTESCGSTVNTSVSTSPSDPPVVSMTHFKSGNPLCSVCNKHKIECDCRYCHWCGTGVWLPMSRRHCRRCWRPVCSRCRTRSRVYQVDQIKGKGEHHLVCQPCAVEVGILVVTTEACDQPFKWGLFALRSAIEAPRACINFSCSRKYGYDPMCYHCKLPTVSMAPCHTRAVEVFGISSKSVERVVALEETARKLCGEGGEGISDAEADSVFAAEFPTNRECAGMRCSSDGFNGRHVVLALSAATFANEHGRFPFLTMKWADQPHASMLCAERLTATHAVFNAPGRVKLVAFPSTIVASSIDDALARMQTPPVVWQEAVKFGCENAKVNASVLAAVRSAPVALDEYIALLESGYRVVLCGHSVGGAVAALTMLHLLMAHEKVVTQSHIRCVTFGAPLFANYQFSAFAEERGYAQWIDNVVYRGDLIPRLSTISHRFTVGELESGGASQLLSSSSTGILGRRRYGSKGELQQAASPWLPPRVDAGDFFCFEREPSFDDVPAVEGSIFTTPRPSLAPLCKRSLLVYDAVGAFHFFGTSHWHYAYTGDPVDVLGRLRERFGVRLLVGDNRASAYALALKVFFNSDRLK